MLRPRSVLACLLLIAVSIGPAISFQVNGGPVSNLLEDVAPYVRNIQKGGTMFEITPEDDEMMEPIKNLSWNEEHAWELERNLLVEGRSYDADEPAGAGSILSRCMVEHGRSFFIGFTRGGGAEDYLAFWITRYDSEIDQWEEPLLVENYSGELVGQVEVTIYDDRVHYIMSIRSEDPGESSVRSTSADIDKWFWLANSTVHRIDDGSDISGQIASIITGSDLVVFWTDRNTGDLIRCYYKDGQWEDTQRVLENVGLFTLQRFRIGGSNRLMLMYTDRNDTRINTTFSSTYGVTWATESNIDSTDRHISAFSSTVHGEILYLLAVFDTDGRARIYHTENGLSWSNSDEDILLDGTTHDGNFDGQISSDRSQVIVGLENDGAVEIHISTDQGDTFVLHERMENGTTDPVLTEKKDLIGIFQGDRMEIHRFEVSNNGRISTTPLSPLGISSWDDVGFQITGLGSGAFAGVKIWNRDMTVQLHPETGWTDMGSLEGGKINGKEVDVYLDLEGGWTEGIDLQGSIRIELYLERSGEQAPAVSGMLVNYSTSFPFSTGFDRIENIVLTSNCTKTGSGYMLTDGSLEGHVIIGPFEIEEDWCDTISFSASAITNRVTYTIELLDRDLLPIAGYEAHRSDPVSGSNVAKYSRWERTFLADLPSTIDIINVRIVMESEISNGRPTIEELSFLYSEAPNIENVDLTTDRLLRGEEAQFIVTLTDRDEPWEFLTIEMMHRTGSKWDSDLFKGQKLGNGVWTIPFVTDFDTEVGTYGMMITVTDSMGVNVTTELDLEIEVLNNIPAPPFAYIDTDRVVSGESVDIVLYREGKDLETDTGDLTYTISSRRDGTIYEKIDGFTSGTYTIPTDVVKKEEEWEISIQTFDGLNLSSPFILEFTVDNSPPEATRSIMNITLEEDGNLSLMNVGTLFNDHDLDQLELSIEAGPGITAELIMGSNIVIHSEPNFNGDSYLVVTAFDGSTNVSHRIDVSVEPVNDPPILRKLSDISVYQGEGIRYFIDAFDTIDDDPVSVSTDMISKVPGLVFGSNFYQMTNGSFILNTTNKMIGDFEIFVTADDGKSQTTGSFNLTILNINDRPSKPLITLDSEKTVYLDNTKVILTANSSDPDLPWGDRLTFTWRSDIQGDLGTGSSLEVDLIEGSHIITVEVTDASGESRSSSIIIDIIEPVGQTGDTLRTSSLKMYSVLTGLGLGILLGALLLILVSKRRKKGEEDSDVDKEEKEETSDKKEEGKGEKEGPKKEEPSKDAEREKPQPELENGGEKNE